MTRKQRAAILGRKGKQPPQPREQWEFVFPEAWEGLGRPFAAGGDLNGDGFSDLVLSDIAHNEGKGRLLVFLGAASGLPGAPSWMREGTIPSRQFGRVVSFLGDVNGDGCDDLFVDRLGVMYGSRNEMRVDEQLSFLGGGVALGDVNGDGFADVALLLPPSFPRSGQEQTLGVFPGGPAGLKPTPAWTFDSDQSGSYFAQDFAPAGDVNGDGFDDLLVGQMKFSGKYPGGGKAFLFFGSSHGLSQKPDWTSEYPLTPEPDMDEAKEQMFSRRLTGVGDVNGDGFDDVAVAAPFAEKRDINEGLVFVYLGSKDGLRSRPDWSAESNQPHCVFGEAIAEACDINGDGFADLIIGAPHASHGQSEEGAVVAYHGARRGLPEWPDWSMESDLSKELLGKNLQSAGDLNGDGCGDVLVVAAGHIVPSAVGLSEQRLRCAVVYGGPRGFAPSHRWPLQKPLVTAAQQSFQIYQRRYGSVVYWGPPLVLLLAVSGGFLFLQSRLRQRIANLTRQNGLMAAEQERARIARNLHDELGADLLKLVGQARKSAKAVQPNADGSEAARQVFESASEAFQTMKQLVWVINPREDTLESFLAYARDYASRLLRSHAIGSEVDFPPDIPRVRLDATLRHHLAAGLKETLRNVVQHANATKVSLAALFQNGQLVLTIQDNGRGMALASATLNGMRAEDRRAQGTEGNGLCNLRKRFSEAGGQFEIQSTPGAGTTVVLRLPLNPPKAS